MNGIIIKKKPSSLETTGVREAFWMAVILLGLWLPGMSIVYLVLNLHGLVQSLSHMAVGSFSFLGV